MRRPRRNLLNLLTLTYKLYTIPLLVYNTCYIRYEISKSQFLEKQNDCFMSLAYRNNVSICECVVGAATHESTVLSESNKSLCDQF